ncbi:MAG TPA: hypothetical protein DCZ95_09885 [Verrucomicrobia bacterium]|nr:MAG: hypothetical protein A2X46_00105 [Lentisphaerae bacterium GWF2_57_35]HBA84390.1 hypothetical protein [Verrucomicrobiota bacterium]
MKKWAMGLLGLLLIVPILAVGSLGWRLLQHEQKSRESLTRTVMQAQAEMLAQKLGGIAQRLERQTLAELAALPAKDRLKQLEALAASRPLYRQAFFHQPGRGLLLPSAGGPLTRDARDFLQRFEPFFSGRQPWEKAPQEREGRTYESDSLLEGCLPWFDQNQLHLLCWRRDPESQALFGVELELMCLLSEWAPCFANQPQGNFTAVLRDGEDQPIFQMGPSLQTEAADSASAPLGPGFPHWRVDVLSDGRPAGVRNLRIFYGLLLGSLLAALFSGEALLLWQARRHYLDAQRKTLFVSNVSHELKTPLTTIRMYAEMLEEGRVPEEGQRARYLHVIGEECRRLTRLVNNVLDFSRIEQHRRTYRPSRVDVAELARSLADQQELRCREKGVRLVREIPGEPVWRLTDRDALEQALLNLLDNALKYGGGEVRVRVSRGPGEAAVEVLDRGPGIPAGRREKIFEKFYRDDDTLTTAIAGSGLGLTIARGLLRDQGGDVRYLPREGGGSCFQIHLKENT